MLKQRWLWVAFVMGMALMVMVLGACVEVGRGEVDGMTGASWKATSTPAEMAAADAQLREAGVKKLTAEVLLREMQSAEPPIVVNVLDAASYKKIHIKGSVSMPYKEMDGLAPKLLPEKEARIVVYCGSYHCHVSVKAARRLKELGYSAVREYRGGIKEWWEKGLPVAGSMASRK